MRRTARGGEIIFWALLATSVVAALFALVVIATHLAEYDLGYVPVASWVVLCLVALLLALAGVGLYLRLQWAAAQRALARLSAQPADWPIPAVTGHEHLKRAEYVAVAQILFHPAAQVNYICLTPLSGGYSGHATLLAELKQARDGERWPQRFVLKLGERAGVEDEYSRYERYVHLALTGKATCYRRATWGDYAGIAYEFVGLEADSDIQTLCQFYQSPSAPIEVVALIEEVFRRLQQAWYRQGCHELLDLHVEYGLLADKEATIRTHVAEVVAPDDPYQRVNLRPEAAGWPAAIPAFCPEPDIPWYDPLAYLRSWGRQPLVLPAHRATVHGDLNSRNVLVEIDRRGQKRPWFIDFSHTGCGLSGARWRAAQANQQREPGRGHTLRDFCRLEADLKFLLTRLTTDDDLRLAVRLELALLDAGMGSGNSWTELPPGDLAGDGRFRKVWRAVGAVRGQAASYLADRSELRPYYMGLLHATLPTLYYQRQQFDGDICERQQKRYALLAAGVACSVIAT